MKPLILVIFACIPTLLCAVDADLPRATITDPLLSSPIIFKIGTTPKSLGHVLKVIGGIQASESDFRTHQRGQVVEEIRLNVISSGHQTSLKFGRDDAYMWTLVLKDQDSITVWRHPSRWAHQYNKKLIPRKNQEAEQPMDVNRP